MSCGKIGLLHSRSSLQWRFILSTIVCLDNIFWTVEHFVTKFGMMMHHHEPECHVGKKLFAAFKVRVTARADMTEIWPFSIIYAELLILWQPNMMWWYIIISRSALWKKLDYRIQGQEVVCILPFADPRRSCGRMRESGHMTGSGRTSRRPRVARSWLPCMVMTSVPAINHQRLHLPGRCVEGKHCVSAFVVELGCVCKMVWLEIWKFLAAA